MNHLNLYIFRQLTIAFLLAASAVTLVILFTQSFRILSLVIDNSATIFVFLQLMALSIPTFLPLVLPVGLGVATLFVYHGLAVDSEIVIMRAAGLSPMRQALPALVLASLVCLLCYGLTLEVTPRANRALVELQYNIRNSFAVFLSRPGNFNDITTGLTFYARKRTSNGLLEGILIHDSRKPESPVTTMAATGQIFSDEGDPHIVVFNGRRQEMNIETGKLSELSFDQYVLDLNSMRSTGSQRKPDVREKTVVELLTQDEEAHPVKGSHEHLVAEVNQRLASPLLVLSFTLIGLATILAGEFNRRGMNRRILIAAVTIVTIEAAFMTMNGMVGKYAWMAFALYLTTTVAIPINFALLKSDSLRRGISVRPIKGGAP